MYYYNYFFSLSKQIIFFSPILTNNNLPLKIYCENIMTGFLNFNFLFFILCFPYFIFYPYFLLFFPFFFPPLFFSSTHIPLIFFFFLFPSFISFPYHFLYTHALTFFLFFLLSSFSLPLHTPERSTSDSSKATRIK